MLLCQCHRGRNVLSVWRQTRWVSGTLYVLLRFALWFIVGLEFFTLRSPPGLAALCPALNQLLKIMKPQDRLTQSLTHINSENRRARSCAAVQQAPKLSTGNGAKALQSCPMAGLQTAGTKDHCHSGLGLLTSAQLSSMLIKISPRQNLCQMSASVTIPGCALL